ncbi:MAG: TetR/AcrR family transcriptional regulator, partial [Candidatus Thorarchaeota archaeon]
MMNEESNTEDLRIQRTKHLLRDAIAKLLETKDLKDISIQQISKKAMIYRTTFYSHYTDKYDLLEDYLIETWKADINFNRTANEEQIKEVYWDGVLDTVKFFKSHSKLFIQLNENKSIIS